MNRLTITEIEKATGGRLIAGSGQRNIDSVCTDSRKAQPGDLFVPIIGENHDAHKFLPQVVEAGCKAILVSDEKYAATCPDCDVILVNNTSIALQELSAYYLKKLGLKTIAVTGSVGKTSTRDMTAAILKEKYVTGHTVGNFNNDIGVPLTIFSFDDSMEAAVLETGMDRKGEIHRLVEIIRPDVGIITNIGISHIENLGSRQAILEAKLEVTDFFGEDNALVINADNDMLAGARFDGPYRVISAGTSEGCDYQVSNVKDMGIEGVSYSLKAGGKNYDVRLHIPGAHNALNSALSIAACSKLGVDIETAIKGLEKIQLTGSRLTVKKAGGVTVIDDTYNAAPDSMKGAIDTLMSAEGARKIAILGDMNELGQDSARYHREVGRYAAEKEAELLIAVGPKASDIAAGFEELSKNGKALHFEKVEDLLPRIGSMLQEGDTLVVKASRSMKLEQIVERIIKEQE